MYKAKMNVKLHISKLPKKLKCIKGLLNICVKNGKHFVHNLNCQLRFINHICAVFVFLLLEKFMYVHMTRVSSDTKAHNGSSQLRQRQSYAPSHKN